MPTEIIALGIPTYNRPKELSTLLDSVPEGVAVYVSDNGVALDLDYRSRYPSVAFFDTLPVLPMFSNWNRALQIAQGDWIAITSDDDIYLPGAFDAVRRATVENPDASVLVFGHHIIDGDGKTVSTWQPIAKKTYAPNGFKEFEYGVEARMPSIFFRKKLLDELGGFDQKFSLTAADSDIIQRASFVANIVFIPDVISGYRVWEGGLTHKKIASQEWMKEIDYWGEKLSQNMLQHADLAKGRLKVRDELYARNLLTGMRLLHDRKLGRQCRSHFFSSRYPYRATMRTQVKMFIELLRSYWNAI